MVDTVRQGTTRRWRVVAAVLLMLSLLGGTVWIWWMIHVAFRLSEIRDLLQILAAGEEA